MKTKNPQLYFKQNHGVRQAKTWFVDPIQMLCGSVNREFGESVTDADPIAPDIFSDKLTGFVERISTHADDCVVTMQVDGNEILLRDRNICCKMHAQVSFLLAQKNGNFMRPGWAT